MSCKADIKVNKEARLGKLHLDFNNSIQYVPVSKQSRKTE